MEQCTVSGEDDGIVQVHNAYFISGDNTTTDESGSNSDEEHKESYEDANLQSNELDVTVLPV